MSRIGKKPIPVPPGVDVVVNGRTVTVKGPLGRLEWALVSEIQVSLTGDHVQVTRSSNDLKERALHGLVRAELNNMVLGVVKGYERSLEITGVGYKGQVQGNVMNLNVGFTHPIAYQIPDGIEAKIEKQTMITIRGIDKRKVGQVAADLRALKPPDVYKQKGIRYSGEKLRKKEGKTGK